MNTIQEINQAIMFGNLTNTELDSVISAVKFRRSELMKENKRSMTLGDTVKFYSTKRGMELKGNVTKIAKKYVTVDTQTGLWRVPANMLEAA
jgi:FKBP-type peptidyl-prolyl cis-trans isomerase 2